MRVTGAKTKREAVDLGLQTLLRLHRQAQIRRLRGTFAWTGDLEYNDRDFDPFEQHLGLRVLR